MGVDARIYLNPHAKPKDIMYVILKSVGHEFKYRATNRFKKSCQIYSNLKLGINNRFGFRTTVSP